MSSLARIMAGVGAVLGCTFLGAVVGGLILTAKRTQGVTEGLDAPIYSLPAVIGVIVGFILAAKITGKARK